MEDQAPSEWLRRGRRVRVVDGSTITMPDTPENQAEYPQQRSQRPGCGLPIARIVAVFSLSVGVVLDAAIGAYQGKRTGENSLFRALHERLSKGDVVLADRNVPRHATEKTPPPALSSWHAARAVGWL